MLRILATTFAGLLGLCFGSFLNVCVSRWPEGESIVHPRSHCRACGRTLAWWENIPLVSWIALRGKCRTCGARISVRYPLVELTVGVLWAIAVWNDLGGWSGPGISVVNRPALVVYMIADLILLWLLVALAVLDFEHLWLPNSLTLTGALIGFVLFMARVALSSESVLEFYGAGGMQSRLLIHLGWGRIVGIAAAAGIVLFSRWLYWLIRRREGVGMGDVKLMAMLAAWLGLPGALLALFLGVVLGAVAAVGVLLMPRLRRGSETRSAQKLPFGTFICIGGIVSALWGRPILVAYMRWAGF